MRFVIILIALSFSFKATTQTHPSELSPVDTMEHYPWPKPNFEQYFSIPIYVEVVDTVATAYMYYTSISGMELKMNQDSIGVDSIILFRMFFFDNGVKKYLPQELREYKSAPKSSYKNSTPAYRSIDRKYGLDKN
jgi:hypothetical protein